MTDDYVSFETARLLKEAGFVVFCDKYFVKPEIIDYYKGRGINANWNALDEYFSRPTLSLAAKWLREVKYLAVMPEFCFSCNWQYRIYLLPVENGYAEDITVGSERLYEAYEDALEAGMNEALEFLINKEK